jgi:hypothetical protein
VSTAISIPMFEGNERKQLERKMQQESRLPPGQALTLKWPVLQLRLGTAFRFNALGLPPLRAGRAAPAPDLGRVQRSPAHAHHQRLSLRHALEPV